MAKAKTMLKSKATLNGKSVKKDEIGCEKRLESRFVSDFISGRAKLLDNGELTLFVDIKSTDQKYNELINELRDKLKALSSSIVPIVFEYCF